MFYHKDYINLRYYQCHQKSVVLGSCQIHGNRCKFSKILIIYWKLKLYHWQQRLSVVFFEVTASLHSFLRIWQTFKPEKMTVENTFILSSKNYVLWEKKASVYFLFCDPEYFLNGEYGHNMNLIRTKCKIIYMVWPKFYLCADKKDWGHYIMGWVVKIKWGNVGKVFRMISGT